MSSARVLALQAVAGLTLVHLQTPDRDQVVSPDGPTTEQIRDEMHAIAGELLRRADSVTRGGPDADPHPPGRVFLVHQVDAGAQRREEDEGGSFHG